MIPSKHHIPAEQAEAVVPTVALTIDGRQVAVCEQAAYVWLGRLQSNAEVASDGSGAADSRNCAKGNETLYALRWTFGAPISNAPSLRAPGGPS